MRIGVFGGTFDPPHEGHLALARAAQKSLELDEVVFVPAKRNPIKRRRTVASPRQRLDMVRLAIADEPKMSASDVEMTRPGPSYSADTMAELALTRPADYWFLLGSDSLAGLPDWHQPERLLRLCRLAVAIRPPATIAEVRRLIPDWARDRVDLVECSPHPASSTEIRDVIGRGLKPRWLGDAVAEYVAREGLYRAEPG